jgi:DNA-binding XRE family transcriptional regulator
MGAVTLGRDGEGWKIRYRKELEGSDTFDTARLVEAADRLLRGRSVTETGDIRRFERLVGIARTAQGAADHAQPRWAYVLRHAREAAGISQAAVAKAAGVTHSIVSRWESGAFPPDATHLTRLAAFYSVLGLPFNPLGGSLAPNVDQRQRQGVQHD